MLKRYKKNENQTTEPSIYNCSAHQLHN